MSNSQSTMSNDQNTISSVLNYSWNDDRSDDLSSARRTTIFRLHDARRSFAFTTNRRRRSERLIVCCKHTPSTYLRKRCIQIAYLNVWSEMVREWQPSMARTEAELIQRVEHSWEALRMKPDYFEKLANSVPRRLQRIIDQGGSAIHY
ncbi:unnamed protein product [Trichogramma brassicae]|uniref:Uncharacterized protein n=1 Tax=Trichogramma brassicae TaxID=86971 RepID=A0A6H5HTT8_9HYME|nr:unnamed protein product [Trichogramma brassicae]